MQAHNVETICRAGAKKSSNLSTKVKDMDADLRKGRMPASRILLRSKSQIRVGTRRYRKTRC